MKRWRQRVSQRSLLFSGLAGLTLAGAIALPHLPTAAVQLSDGTTAFTNPPRLVDFVTLDTRAFERRPTYYVTVNLLPDAGEPLQTLTVRLIEGRFTRLDFRAVEVFAGTRGDRGAEYAIAAADYDDDAQTLTIQLAEPAAPGQQLTFALQLIRNPRQPGVYLYEVTAAPAGQQPRFQRVGTGRIHIYAGNREPFWP